MIIFREIHSLQKYLHQQRQNGKRIGFVPTMGALHQGHLSLIRLSKSAAAITVCSIFVNPTQFNDPRDFEKYPVTTAKDIHLLETELTDILFLPPVEEIYPGGMTAGQHYELGYLETILEGAYRPGHFQGVCQVVHRLLNIVKPHLLFLGQKDYQQCMVLKKLVQLIGSPTEIIIAPTVREESGLAMSSRNMRLTEAQRSSAKAIHQCLLFVKEHLHLESAGELQRQAKETLLRNGFTGVDYIAIANAYTLEPLDPSVKWDGEIPVVALVAAFMGEVRLIDNVLLT